MAGVRDVPSCLDDLFRWANDPTPRIPFGISVFDGPTGGGIARSETCMMLAASSVGKTNLGLEVIRHNPGIPTMVFSLEMGGRNLTSRLVAKETGQSTQEIEAALKHGMSHEFRQAVADRYRWLVIDDTPAITLRDAKESMHKAQELLGHDIRLVLWDYLELIGGVGMLNKTEAVDRAAQRLRDFHREFDCAGIVLHQAKMSGDTGGFKPLSLEGGKYGGHQPMDYVIAAYAPRLNPALDDREYKQVQAEIWLQLLKNRNGAAQPIGVRYHQDPVTTRITPWEQPLSYLPSGYQQRALV